MLRVWSVTNSVALLSALIEEVQYVGGYGLCELEDIIFNMIGTIIGFAL